MDTDLLVDNQIDDGQRLLEQLERDGFPVVVAFWVKTSEESPWQLCIASPSVDPETLGDAYRRVYASLNKIPDSWVLPSDIKLRNHKDPIAVEAAEIRDRGRKGPTRYHGNRLGDDAIKHAYIYEPVDPEKVWLRQAFSITYVRQDDTNAWRATTERRELYRGIKARGAVSYSTAHHEGEGLGDQKLAIVTVLIDIDPQLDELSILDKPDIRQMWVEQAQKMADEWFMSRHPDAVVRHENGHLQ